jgi:predicted amidophosphoribosyltransferase
MASRRVPVSGSLLGACCVVCRAPGRALCGDCVARRPSAVTVALPASRAAGASVPPVLTVPIVAAGRYDGPLGTAVRAVKYGAAVDVTEDLADRLACVVASSKHPGSRSTLNPSPAPTAIVPVPTDPRRRRRRGHDPVRRLADALGRRLQLPVAPCVVCAPGRRVHAGTDAASRRRPDPYRYLLLRAPPPVALVLDDVVTTGATLGAVCRVLVAAGCVALPCVVAVAGRD